MYFILKKNDMAGNCESLFLFKSKLQFYYFILTVLINGFNESFIKRFNKSFLINKLTLV